MDFHGFGRILREFRIRMIIIVKIWEGWPGRSLGTWVSWEEPGRSLRI